MAPAFTSFQGFCTGFGASFIKSWSLAVIIGQLEDSIILAAIGLIVYLTVLHIRKIQITDSKLDMTDFQIHIRAFVLGWGFNCGLYMILSNDRFPFGVYICLLCGFHYSEFLVTSFISPETLSLSSFLLNHSKEYGIAAIASVLEFLLEWHFFPFLKNLDVVTYIGIGLCLGGEFFRKWSMFTASRNFTHIIRDHKSDSQYLVTSGPYSHCRHPGYAGWFWWSIGTQLVMINPICFVGYCFAVHRFFQSRIYYEEVCLLSFFGTEYVEYQNKVSRTGVPFVEGYVISKNSTHMGNVNRNDTDSS